MDKRLVKFLASLIMSGGFDDAAETGLEFLWDMLPASMTEDIAESGFGRMLDEIVRHLDEFLKKVRRWHPGHVIAEPVCREIGYGPPT